MNLGESIGLKYGLPTRNAFGETLRELGRENPDIVVVDGDVSNSTRTEFFAHEFPERFFDVGIAESTMIGVASGLAASGKQPLADSFAAFLLNNAYEQIRMSIAFPQLNVKLVGSHSGISVGEDGPSQMAIEDIALATALPHFTVLAPADEPSTRAATRAMFTHRGPVYMRTGRPKFPIVYTDGAPFQIGVANRLDDAASGAEQDVTLIACGLMVAAALEAAAQLAKENIRARVLDMHTIKPIDQAAIISAARETGAIVTAEEHLLDGGLGSAVARVVTAQYPVPVEMVGLRNQFAESGESQELLEKYGLMPADIVRAARQALDRKRALKTR
ncbi:MAG: transketolase family protein [Chloroflexi bacterium]|nr:transketolase family protein [Chloroflexota bacterium]